MTETQIKPKTNRKVSFSSKLSNTMVETERERERERERAATLKKQLQSLKYYYEPKSH